MRSYYVVERIAIVSEGNFNHRRLNSTEVTPSSMPFIFGYNISICVFIRAASETLHRFLTVLALLLIL